MLKSSFMPAHSQPDAQDAAALIERVKQRSGALCAACHQALCRHEVLASLAFGAVRAPRCLACLADALAQQPESMAQTFAGYLKSRECYRTAWEWINQNYASAKAPCCRLAEVVSRAF
jgi:hypothetical protein